LKNCIKEYSIKEKAIVNVDNELLGYFSTEHADPEDPEFYFEIVGADLLFEAEIKLILKQIKALNKTLKGG